jgi:hypothetical protein
MSIRRPVAVAVAAVASSAAVVPVAQAKSLRAPDARHTAYVHQTGASSFDWNDAAVGAGGALVALVAAGSAAGLTIRRRPATGLTG